MTIDPHKTKLLGTRCEFHWGNGQCHKTIRHKEWHELWMDYFYPLMNEIHPTLVKVHDSGKLWEGFHKDES